MLFLTFESFTGVLVMAACSNALFLRTKRYHPVLLLSSCLQCAVTVTRVFLRNFDWWQSVYESNHELLILSSGLLHGTRHLSDLSTLRMKQEFKHDWAMTHLHLFLLVWLALVFFFSPDCKWDKNVFYFFISIIIMDQSDTCEVSGVKLIHRGAV